MSLPVVVGGGQIDGLRPHRRQGEDGLPVGIVHPARMGFAGLESAQPVGLGDPQMHLREITVADADTRPRLRPRAFCLDRKLLRLDLRDEIFAHRAAGALWVHLGTLQYDGPRLDEIALFATAVSLLEQAREVKPRQGGRLVVTSPLDELFQCVLLAVGEVGGIALRHCRTACPQDAIEIGGEEGRAVGVAAMKFEQTSIELRGFEERRVEIGDRLVGFRLPGEKRVRRAERGAGGVEFEGVFRGDQAAFAGRGKFEGVADDHVPHGGPVGVGQFPRLDDRRPFSHRQALQGLSFGTAGAADRHAEPLANLADDCRQIPLGDGLQIVRPIIPIIPSIRFGAAGRPLLKPPAVHLEETPGPVGADRLQHATCFGRGLVHGTGQQNQPLGIVAGSVARFGENPRGDRAGRLGPCLVGDRPLLHAPQRLERRLWLAFRERLVDGLPGSLAWSVWSVVAAGISHGHAVASEKKSGESQDHGGGTECAPRST